VEPSDSYLGANPPVQINAQQCGTVKIEVKFITETREHDTLRRWADLIERVLDYKDSGKISGLFAGCGVLVEWMMVAAWLR
jgi:hypothetical protein